MESKETVLFGVPVPSDDNVFLAFVISHIILGLICVLAGLIAMLAGKTSNIHKYAGKVYFMGYTALFITIIMTSIMRWPHNTHLLSIGSLGYLMACTGRYMARHHPKNWTKWHTVLMGLSYVILLAGFYVDNGRHLPFWNQFSRWQLFIFPFIIGIPIIFYALVRHPLNKRYR